MVSLDNFTHLRLALHYVGASFNKECGRSAGRADGIHNRGVEDRAFRMLRTGQNSLIGRGAGRVCVRTNHKRLRRRRPARPVNAPPDCGRNWRPRKASTPGPNQRLAKRRHFAQSPGFRGSRRDHASAHAHSRDFPRGCESRVADGGNSRPFYSSRLAGS